MNRSPTEEFGPYLVYEQLGIGGMAQVHRAVLAEGAGEQGFAREVALKRMLEHVASDDELVRAFVREARLASYLRHENVAQTYDLGRVDDIYFIVMELVQGRNLREVLKHCGMTTGPMPVPIALNILNQICDALDYAHNLRDETGQPLGIIHRDVSPSNIIVSDSGVVKLIDFGIAKASAAGMQTMSGTLKGKFGYMAPEYIAGSIDARADLFAIGVIAHELLTNRPLFTGRDDLETLKRVRDMQIAPPSRTNNKVPSEIDDIVMTALARDPDRRWQHATALRAALTTLTKRLGMVVHNAQVVQWLDWAFAQTAQRPHSFVPVDGGDTDEASDPSISIEEPQTAVLSSAASAAAAAAANATANALAGGGGARSSGLAPGGAPKSTLMMPGPAPSASGTPASITAQRSVPPTPAGTPASEPAVAEDQGYRAALATYERRQELPPGTAVPIAISRVSSQRMAAQPTVMEHVSPQLLDAHRAAQQARVSSGQIPIPPGPPSGPISAPLAVPAHTSGAVPIQNPVTGPRSAQHAAQFASSIGSGAAVPISAQVAAQTESVVALPSPAPRSKALTVFWVLLAALAAGAAVYFLLPLIT